MTEVRGENLSRDASEIAKAPDGWKDSEHRNGTPAHLLHLQYGNENGPVVLECEPVAYFLFILLSIMCIYIYISPCVVPKLPHDESS